MSVPIHIQMKKIRVLEVFCTYTYNTVILVRSFINFIDRNFLFIVTVQAFLDLITCRSLTKDKQFFGEKPGTNQNFLAHVL